MDSEASVAVMGANKLGGMTLAEFALEKKRAIFEDLGEGREPREGAFDHAVLTEARKKGPPQMGTTRFEPDAIVLEYIFPDSSSAAAVLSVRIPSPERIVFLPVPEWVLECIWQGSIDGSYHFESEAERMLSAYREECAPDANLKWFGPRAPTHRE